MNKDTLKGKAKDVAGRIKRQAGEWTDREDLQAEGAGEQIEGKLQKGVGKVKEMGREAKEKLERRRREHQMQERNKNKEDHAA